MQAGSQAVQDKVVELVEAILAENALPGGVRPDTHLADAGFTSMEMVNLMLAVEAAFDITLPQAEITPENFKTIEAVSEMIARQTHARAA